MSAESFQTPVHPGAASHRLMEEETFVPMKQVRRRAAGARFGAEGSFYLMLLQPTVKPQPSTLIILTGLKAFELQLFLQPLEFVGSPLNPRLGNPVGWNAVSLVSSWYPLAPEPPYLNPYPQRTHISKDPIM